MERLSDLFSQLRERRAFQWIAAYAVAAWAVAQVVGFFVEQGYIGRRLLDIALFLLAVGFFGVLVGVWQHGAKGAQPIKRLEIVAFGVLSVIASAGILWLATRTISVSVDPDDVFVELGENSIAVLPFTNNVADPDLAWLDEGLPDLLATDLAQVPSLKLVSAQRMGDLLRQLDIPDGASVPPETQVRAAQLSGAQFMLTGRVSNAGDELQLSVTLAVARGGEITAAARGQGRNVFDVVDQVSADLLRRVLAPQATELTPVAELTTDQVEAYAEYQRGLDAEEAFLLPEARAHYEAAIALDSTFASAHFHLAGLLTGGGEIVAAMESLERARRYAPQASVRDRLFMEGLQAMIIGDFTVARDRMGAVIDQFPDDKEARLTLASFLSGSGTDPEYAEELMEDVIALDPTYGLAYNFLGYQHARRGEADTAIALMERYVRIDSENANPWDSKGEVLEAVGRFDEAREAYREALEIDPNYRFALTHLVRSYLREDRPADARAELQTYVDRGDFAPVYDLVANTHLWEGAFDAAMDAYREGVRVAIETGDLGAQARSETSHLYSALEIGRNDEAAAVAAQILEREPNPIVFTVQAVTAGERGDVEDVGRQGDDFEATYRNNSAFVPFFPFIAAMFRSYEAFYRGEYERAISLAANSPLAIPGEGTEYIGYPVMRSLLALGDGDRALRHVSTVREAGMYGPPPAFPFDPLQERFILYFTGRAQELRGDTAQAIAAYRALTDAWGETTREVPLVSDTIDRLAALLGESGVSPTP